MVTAFIPVRGGSKSIPLKNIRPFCGKPLVYWNVAALQECSAIDRVIVATDSKEIVETVLAFGMSKVTIYNRKPENAADTSSTESVMLEYLEANPLPDDDIFVLVQATSPLTSTSDFDGAFKLYSEEKYDSIISCVRTKRFYWNPDGTPLNYDYLHRPRRQDFAGMFMENGAFYINTVKGILSNGNRLGGRIGVYEMPEYTSFEIDEPDDWIIMEALMKRHILSKKNKSIKLFVSDIDGTLTDAGMYYSDKGEELKKFNTRDGMGFRMLREAGIKTGLITTETTPITEMRARKLKVDFMIQGQRGAGKLDALQEILRGSGITLDEVAYIGDDINCIELLENVGAAACPADATQRVKSIPGISVMSLKGGEGCVREFIEKLLP